MQIDLAADDLMSSVPAYNTGFRSGPDQFRQKQAKGNLPSQEGGIFGGGSYAADAVGAYKAPTPSLPPQSFVGGGAAQQSSRPKGNQSSVEGGIFAPVPSSEPPPSSRSNRSNQSSIQVWGAQRRAQLQPPLTLPLSLPLTLPLSLPLTLPLTLPRVVSSARRRPSASRRRRSSTPIAVPFPEGSLAEAWRLQRRGVVRRGEACEARRGVVRRGEACEARRGVVRRGEEW